MARLSLSPPMAVGLLASLGMHVGWIVTQSTGDAHAAKSPEPPIALTMEVETQREQAAPLPEPSRPEPDPALPGAAARPSPSANAPPAAAQAGRVLTAPDDTSAVASMVDFTMVQGSGDRYAGGVTAATGTQTRAVADTQATGGGKSGGTGAAPLAAPHGPDLSHPASPAARDWSCSHLFPPEADAEKIHVALVRVIVSVRADGRAQSVIVLDDPGNGFGRAARACALSQKYSAARDRSGNPATGTTAPFTVRFTR